MLAQLEESVGSNLRETGNDLGQPDTYDLLVRSYSDATRHYHTTQHLAECLELFDQVRSHAEHPAEVEVALWCHDAIYVPTQDDNEQCSAVLARDLSRLIGLTSESERRIEGLVMATQPGGLSTPTADEQLLMDIDLSILAASPARFSEYEAQVRMEYAHVPEAVFRRERARILNYLLIRPAIYGSAPLRHLESAARANLQHSIDALVR